jgi:hypothetical protein
MATSMEKPYRQLHIMAMNETILMRIPDCGKRKTTMIASAI